MKMLQSIRLRDVTCSPKILICSLKKNCEPMLSRVNLCRIRHTLCVRAYSTNTIAKYNAYDTRTRRAAKPARTNRVKNSSFADLAARDKIFQAEIADFLLQQALDLEAVENGSDTIELFYDKRSRPHTQLDATVLYQTADGDGLALISKSYLGQNGYTVVQIPKTLVGDKVQIRVKRHFRWHAEAEVIGFNEMSPQRNNDLVVCSHFDSCSGCQFQMVGYDEQLKLKQNTIRKAYKFFFPDQPQSSDAFGMVVPSPLQYAYRSKLTPHYHFQRENFTNKTVPNIGFQHSSKDKGIVDIHECPLATPTVQKALSELRKETQSSITTNYEKGTKQKGATLLLRESLRIDSQTGESSKTCLTDGNKVCTEKIGDSVFQFPANEFFQVNSAVLPDVVDFVRYSMASKEIKNIVDAYCGSGFFSVSLANDVKKGKVVGIEISRQAIKYATHNAKLNGLAVPQHVQFVEGTSNAIFKHESFLSAQLDPEETMVIIDPSRKGSDESFLQQLHEFGPKLVVYVSCNVFSQARDLQYFMAMLQKYAVRDVIGFDFFPQTKHVECVAVLERV